MKAQGASLDLGYILTQVSRDQRQAAAGAWGRDSQTSCGDREGEVQRDPGSLTSVNRRKAGGEECQCDCGLHFNPTLMGPGVGCSRSMGREQCALDVHTETLVASRRMGHEKQEGLSPNACPQGFGLQCNLTLLTLEKQERDQEHREEGAWQFT